MLSIVFKRWNLNPGLFGGKEKVTLKQICKFVVDEGYPEFKDNRVGIVEDKGTLILSVTGSRKGAVAELESLEDVDCFFKQSADYDLATYCNYRCELTPLGKFFISSDYVGSFQMRLPKIPRHIMDEVVRLFKVDYAQTGLEMAVQLFYNSNRGYFVHIPGQERGEVYVDITRNVRMEVDNVLVADIHSHGAMGKFFSSVDDADELGTRIFGVYGRIGKDDEGFIWRVGAGGNFLCISEDDIFE